MTLNGTKTGLFIFLAEDDIDDQELLIEALSNLDNTIIIHTANNGKKAVHYLEQLAASQAPQLIILDFNLPELSGADILKHLHSISHFNDVPKIVWSTSNSPVYEKQCLDLGAKAYVVKPSDVSGIDEFAKFVLKMCTVKK